MKIRKPEDPTNCLENTQLFWMSQVNILQISWKVFLEETLQYRFVLWFLVLLDGKVALKSISDCWQDKQECDVAADGNCKRGIYRQF